MRDGCLYSGKMAAGTICCSGCIASLTDMHSLPTGVTAEARYMDSTAQTGKGNWGMIAGLCGIMIM